MLHNHTMTLEAATATSDADWQWTAVMTRDSAADGRFVYAVTSTGIFCRPSCSSRRPRRDRVRFFASSDAAAAAGFRACRRCRPEQREHRSTHRAIARASAYLAAHADETVSLATLARVTGLSASHLQRRFKAAVGLSPREYQAAHRADRFRRELRAGRDVVTATYAAGYGSPSRVHAAAPTGHGMPPATYRRGGEGAEISHVTTRCDLGWLLVAATRRGVCAVMLGDSPEELESALRRDLPRATITAGEPIPASWIAAVIAQATGTNASAALPLDVRGTAFQWRVWRALREIPAGATHSYSEVAAAIGQPTAVRAVARACATNPVCLLVPCHRVIGKAELGGYRWGVERKARLLEREKKHRGIAPR